MRSYGAPLHDSWFYMKPWKELGRYGGIGIELVLSILILGALGHWLDGRYWGGHGWGMATGFLLGVAAGVRNLARAAARMQKDIERAEADDPLAGRWTVDESWVHKPADDTGAARPDAENGRTRKDGDDLN
jgi:Putative F0F1-ATPase subunit Ca2+/Mg2+ transporter